MVGAGSKIRAVVKAWQLAKNMGGRYVSFRLLYALQRRIGIQRKRFPVRPERRRFITLNEWRSRKERFFFKDRFSIPLPVPDTLREDFQALSGGQVKFFSALTFPLGTNYDWLTNPDTGYRYPSAVHWTEVDDYSREAGDIKFVWEKSRFTFLYTIIRYDAYTGEDHSEMVFDEILSWINANPINCGPNYKCSQEIALRVFNWTFALHFYKSSSSLTERVFQEIMHAIYWQLQHVFQNINFSRIAVRNNHAITETLMLYLGGLLYPFFPEAQLWKERGKKWFEEEIAYQIYSDGTFLQFSMNYHRVVVQLLTIGLRLAELNGERFSPVVYDRARKSLDFLLQCMDTETGWLPNYGSNDGALFFPLSSTHFRDFRPQLQALSHALGLSWKYGNFEDVYWFGLHALKMGISPPVMNGFHRYGTGGYYLFRTEDSFAMIRCGQHKDRPFQADNLHLDWWVGDRNILHDGGSFKYNADVDDIRYFMGTASHNTVMLGNHDQMEKGARFIWYYWSQAVKAVITEDEESYCFEGMIKAFQHISPKVRHKRRVWIYKRAPILEVEDEILHKPYGLDLRQLWHTRYPQYLNLTSKNSEGRALQATVQQGWVSDLYGVKEPCTELVFTTNENRLVTRIEFVK